MLKVFLLVSGGVLLGAASGPNWQAMPPERFRQLPELQAPIDFAHYDRGLMSAAIFHESNRVRQQFGRRKFRHLPQLDEAADLQANIGALLPGISHRNPLPNLNDVMDRIHAAGLRPELAAENLALSMTLDGDPKTVGFGLREENGEKHFFEPRTGRVLKPMTYAAFATAVVQQWMDSPGHRANLLNPNLENLGCGARWRKDFSGMDLLYSVQVFSAGS